MPIVSNFSHFTCQALGETERNNILQDAAPHPHWQQFFAYLQRQNSFPSYLLSHPAYPAYVLRLPSQFMHESTETHFVLFAYGQFVAIRKTGLFSDQLQFHELAPQLQDKQQELETLFLDAASHFCRAGTQPDQASSSASCVADQVFDQTPYFEAARSNQPLC